MPTLLRGLSLLACLGAGISLPAQPAAVPLANPSFESPYLVPGSYRTGEITGWTREGGTRTHLGIQSISPGVFAQETPESPLPPPADGAQFAFLNPPVDGQEMALYQVIGTLRPHTRYVFTVAIGNRLDKGYPDKLLLELRNGDTLSSPVLVSASNPSAPENGAFADHSVSFSTGAYVSGNLLIAIRNQSSNQIAFDHARVTIESSRNPPPPTEAP